jgi:hypothetical protein
LAQCRVCADGNVVGIDAAFVYYLFRAQTCVVGTTSSILEMSGSVPMALPSVQVLHFVTLCLVWHSNK